MSISGRCCHLRLFWLLYSPTRIFLVFLWTPKRRHLCVRNRPLWMWFLVVLVLVPVAPAPLAPLLLVVSAGSPAPRFVQGSVFVSVPQLRTPGCGLGHLSRGRPAVRLVASGVFELFDQPLGTPSGPLRCSGFSAGPSGSFGVSLCGQHDSSVLSSEARGDSLLHSECCRPDHSPSLRRPSDFPSSAIHFGSPERSCGHSQSPLADLGLGMDPLSSGISGVASPMAGEHRHVCDFLECSSPSVLCSSCGSAVGGHGCHDSVVGRSSGVCLPYFRPSASCAVEGSAIQGSGAHPCGSVLASVPLVSRPSGASGGCPSVPSTTEGSTQTAAFPPLPPEPPCALSNCVPCLERSTRAFGFTSAVARQLARCWRASTRVNYQAKWSVFRAWCRRHGHSVSRPSVPKIASFLLYLRHSLSLSYSSIASYRSMLSGVFRFVLPELSSHFVLSDLRSFRLERPLSSSRVPLSLLVLFVTLPGRCSSWFCWRLLVGWVSHRLSLLRSLLPVGISFWRIFRSFGLIQSPRLVRFLALSAFIPWQTLWVIFLMNYFSVLFVRALCC